MPQQTLLYYANDEHDQPKHVVLNDLYTGLNAILDAAYGVKGLIDDLAEPPLTVHGIEPSLLLMARLTCDNIAKLANDLIPSADRAGFKIELDRYDRLKNRGLITAGEGMETS